MLPFDMKYLSMASSVLVITSILAGRGLVNSCLRFYELEIVFLICFASMCHGGWSVRSLKYVMLGLQCSFEGRRAGKKYESILVTMVAQPVQLVFTVFDGHIHELI